MYQFISLICIAAEIIEWTRCIGIHCDNCVQTEQGWRAFLCICTFAPVLEALVVPLGFRRGAPTNDTGSGNGTAPHDAAFALRMQDGKEIEIDWMNVSCRGFVDESMIWDNKVTVQIYTPHWVVL